MPQDKRPRPTIDMTPDPANKPTPRIELPSGANPPNDRSGPQKPPPMDRAAQTSVRRGGGGFFSHLLAGLIGAGLVVGGAYLALTHDIPGLSLTDPGTRRQIQKLQDRTAEIDRTLRSSSGNAYSASGSGSAPEGLNELQARVDGIVNAARGLDETVQSLSQRLEAVEQRAGGRPAKDAIQAELAGQIAPLTQRLASLERDLEAISRTQNERQSDARTAALTLALTNLKRAIGDGRPFSAELAAVENLSTLKLPVSQLAPYKEGGVLSMAELQRDFAAASQKALQSYYRGKGNSFMGEVFSRAKAAIQIKPADGKGDTPEAILGRMDNALKAGNLRDALTEAAALDGPAQEEMQSWLGKAQQRATAEEALRKTDQELIAAMTKAPARRP